MNNAINPTAVVPFQFESNEVRTLTKPNGDLWFVAKDICTILGIVNDRDALSRIPDHHKGVASTDTLGGKQKANIISESGMYRLVLRSDKPQAEPFIEWVTSEVIPTIRKTGGYALNPIVNRLLDLNVEVKEGVSLLNQVIGTERLHESQRWQLVDQLLIELFGCGVEILIPQAWTPVGPKQPAKPNRSCYFRKAEEVEEAVLVMRYGFADHRLAIHKNWMAWFVSSQCETGNKLAASQETLYRLFSSWFTVVADHPAPTFALFHDAMVEAMFRPVTLVGEPWFVGLAPKGEVSK